MAVIYVLLWVVRGYGVFLVFEMLTLPGRLEMVINPKDKDSLKKVISDYIPEEKDPYHYEGSYFETENLYEIFVYYSPIGALADQLVGYSNITHNRRP